ncbi:AI-2E family transporter [Methylomicrobium sp. RS1]|uniref:AI-2E family transporter n=1 Tax=Candidatus Methylomicrobium oryzae TaxID=2802053 RepID=UPI0019215DCA|nr:AI-2E family transporter [Methylomicrobium sp. RS1]MBL1265937.1 AI-2E family transporter [Methylomicrobium sp. RS1]
MTDSQKWLLFSITGLAAWLTYLLAPILTPFVVSMTLAYLGDPLTDRLERYRLSRSLAVTLVFLAMTLIFVLILLWLVPQLERQIGHFIDSLPAYAQFLNEGAIPWLNRRFNLDVQPFDTQALVELIKSHWQSAGGAAKSLLRSLSHSGGMLLGWLMNLLLVPVVTFYLLRDWDSLMAKLYNLLPRRIAPSVAKLTGEFDTVLSAFLRGQFYVMLALGSIYSVGLALVGIDLALLIGMTSGLLSFVPYLGTAIGIFSASLAALLQFQDTVHLFWVLAVFGVGQVLEGSVLTPLLVGDKIGLHPVAVIFAVLAGGQLFGFIGILLALPVASMIMVVLRHVHDWYKDSDFYSLT